MAGGRGKKINQRSRSNPQVIVTIDEQSSLSMPPNRARAASDSRLRRRNVSAQPLEPPAGNGNVIVSQPGWLKHVTVRAIIISLVLSLFYVTVTMKLTLSSGIVPSLNISVGLAAFVMVKLLLKLVGPISGGTFTPQENVIVQACVGAAISVVYSGGFGNYLFAMSSRTADQSGKASTPEDIMDLSLVMIIAFLVVVNLAGFTIVTLFWKVMILDFKLSYPSGTASGHLINALHALGHDILAKEEMRVLLISSACSFFWNVFRWIFTRGVGCGIVLPIPFPKAYENGFYLELSAAYAGIGMLCSYMINISQLVGGIVSAAFLWPFFDSKKGDWYSTELEPTSMSGLQGYKVFLAIATITGEGVYNCAIIGLSFFRYDLYKDFCARISGPSTRDDSRRDEVFTRGKVETQSAFYSYVIAAAMAFLVVTWIFFNQLEWTCILGIYVVAPFLAFFNAYGCGLTDVSLASAYGKIAIFVVGGVWSRISKGSVITGLAACGLVTITVTTASDLLHDFKTGYMTLTPPRSILTSQVIGIIMGCIISPCVLWFFYRTSGGLGILGSAYSVPYALVYRTMSTWVVEGTALPKYCTQFFWVFVIASVIISAIRDSVDKKWVKFIPGPMTMAIGVLTRVAGVAPDSVGSNFTLDMCLGSLFIFIWRKKNKDDAEARGLVVASGLICGEGIWTLVSLCLALGGVKPPFCMKLLSDQEMAKLNIKPS